MAANKKSLFLLKVNSEGSFKTIAGLQASSIRYNNQRIDSSNIASGKWRDLLEKSGLTSLAILANGIFKNSEYEEVIRLAVFANEQKNMQLEFKNGDVIEGSFAITNYERRGSLENEEIYSFVLETSGEFVMKKAS